jgi:hypothetical protein
VLQEQAVKPREDSEGRAGGLQEQAESSHERVLRGERAGFRSKQSQATRGF